MDEADRQSNKQNGDILTDFLNENLFTNYKVLCSVGMREFLVWSASQQRAGSFRSSGERGSSVKSRKSDVDPFYGSSPDLSNAT